MAITKNDCNFLFYAKKRFGVSFDKSLMLGRLNLYVSQIEIKAVAKKYELTGNDSVISGQKLEYAEPLFMYLGADTVDSIDYSDYEGATIVSDLNLPIQDHLKNKYSLVFDGGTIEHVFNFPVAIKNCMLALKVGGHYIGVSPSNNLMGHGFYQFSPELYFRVFSEENGFILKEMLISINNKEGKSDWYRVADPMNVKERVALMNGCPVSLTFIAEKVAAKEIFSTPPQQSDYSVVWHNKELSHFKHDSQFSLKKIIPVSVKTKLRKLYNVFFESTQYDEMLGEFNPKHFVKVEL